MVNEPSVFELLKSLLFQMDKFQVVLTLGDDGKTYVLFLYETVGSFPATTPVRVCICTDVLLSFFLFFSFFLSLFFFFCLFVCLLVFGLLFVKKN